MENEYTYMNQAIADNLATIKALRNSKIQSPRVRDILARRERHARREITGLRDFAGKHPGTNVAEVCTKIANEIEEALK
jgi:hypothetical protein